jgi:hypothetical protein
LKVINFYFQSCDATLEGIQGTGEGRSPTVEGFGATFQGRLPKFEGFRPINASRPVCFKGRMATLEIKIVY